MKKTLILILLLTILTISTISPALAINRYTMIETPERKELGFMRYTDMTGPSVAWWRQPDANFGYFLINIENGTIRQIGDERYTSTGSFQLLGSPPKIFDRYVFSPNDEIMDIYSLQNINSLSSQYNIKSIPSYYSGWENNRNFYYNPFIKTISSSGTSVTISTPITYRTISAIGIPSSSGGITLLSGTHSDSGTQRITRSNNYYGLMTSRTGSTNVVYNNKLEKIAYPSFDNLYFPQQNPTSTSAYGFSGSSFTQYSIINNLSTTRTINLGAGHTIQGLEILKNNRVLVVGKYVDSPDTFGFHSIYDNSGNLITNSLWAANSTIKNPVQVDDTTIAWILHTLDNDRHYLEFRDTTTFGLKSGYPREYFTHNDVEQWITGISNKVNYDDGHNPSAYRPAEFGIVCSTNPCTDKSNTISNIDIVPKDAYLYMYNGTKPANWEYTDIDFTNRKIAVTITDAGNIDNLPITFLASDGRKDTTESYGYIIREDLTFLQNLNTGLMGGSSPDNTTLNLTNIIANDRLYVFDINMSIARTADNIVSNAYFYIDDVAEPYEIGIADINIFPSYSLTREYKDRNATHLLGNNIYLTRQKDRPALLIGYDADNNKELDFVNLRLYMDTKNDMNSIRMQYKYSGESFKDAGYVYYLTQDATKAHKYIHFFTGADTEAQIVVDVYRMNTIPTMTPQNRDVSFSNAYALPVQILREGKNTIEVSYSPSGTGQHANNVVWEYDVTMINGAILGIPSTILPQPPSSDDGVEQGSSLFGGLLPDFMPTTQQSATIYGFAIILLVMLIVFLIGHGSGYAMMGGIGAMGFGIMLLLFFSIIGWIPAWIPVVSFVIAGLIGASIIKNSFSSGA
jgi:hypothetical protein